MHFNNEVNVSMMVCNLIKFNNGPHIRNQVQMDHEISKICFLMLMVLLCTIFLVLLLVKNYYIYISLVNGHKDSHFILPWNYHFHVYDVSQSFSICDTVFTITFMHHRSIFYHYVHYISELSNSMTQKYNAHNAKKIKFNKQQYANHKIMYI